MLWVDKHRPNTLEKLTVHPQLTDRLSSLAQDGEIPHLLFYGPPGAGKKTRIMALLRQIFGPGVEKLRLEHRDFKTPSNATVELTTVASNYHIEMCPGDAGNNDRFVVQDIIKEIAQNNPLNLAVAGGHTLMTSSKGGEGGVCVMMTSEEKRERCKGGLKGKRGRLYTSSCRLILCCTSPSKVIEPVRSRCLGVRVPAPSLDAIGGVLTEVCRRESLALPPALAARVAQASGRNLRRAVLMLEACRVRQYPFTEDQEVAYMDWEIYISNLARDITSEQSPQRLLAVRGKLYNLLANCIPADVILETLTRELMKTLDDELKHEVAYWAAHYEHSLATGSKEIYHLEAFVAKFMSIYKRFMISLFG
ncbi:unnamed protein product [Heterosigma akashiwo]